MYEAPPCTASKVVEVTSGYKLIVCELTKGHSGAHTSGWVSFRH